MSYYPGDEDDVKKKKKKLELTQGKEDSKEEEDEEYKDEENESVGSTIERAMDKEGKSKGDIAKNQHSKGKKMSEAKMKLHKKLSMRLASSKGKVY